MQNDTAAMAIDATERLALIVERLLWLSCSHGCSERLEQPTPTVQIEILSISSSSGAEKRSSVSRDKAKVVGRDKVCRLPSRLPSVIHLELDVRRWIVKSLMPRYPCVTEPFAIPQSRKQGGSLHFQGWIRADLGSLLQPEALDLKSCNFRGFTHGTLIQTRVQTVVHIIP